jgi:HD superfamily phosphodiesterase
VKHTELETSLKLENERVEKICRATQIETRLQDLQAKEEYNRQQENERVKRESDEAFRRKETLRTTRERKRAEERRRTQEIVLPKDM